ncbi:MAG: replicative DNA helicase [Chloroflexi bacterium]|nr:replicative DNA helicase [Chloroflexota bacterium]MDA1296877.1 replicative DNA helicase [Chloroflexota bacterium]
MLQAERLPPHDIQAEESVVGSLLINGHAIADIQGFLKAEDFYRQRNRLCFEAVVELFNRDEAINTVTVSHELESKGLLEEVGGTAYLAHLVATVPTSVHVVHFGQLVRRTATMRRLINAASNIAEIGYADDADVDGALSSAEDIIFNVRTGQVSRDFVHIGEALDPYLQEASALDALDDDKKPIPTGYSNMDQLFGGLQRSDMIVLAARPSVGKSTLALNLAANAAKEHARVGIFSLEMGREQVAMRLLASEARLNMHDIRLRRFSPTEETRLVDAIGLLSDLAIYIDDTPFQTVTEMRGKARRLQLMHGLDFVVVDYMQLINGSSGGREGNRAQEVSEISRHMKAMARDLNVPVIAVSQLSRAIERRESHRPVLSDLRESGSIEQDADIVMFIHREDRFTSEEQWNAKSPQQPYPRGLAELIVAKHRHGPIDTLWMSVRDEHGRFMETRAQAAVEQRY